MFLGVRGFDRQAISPLRPWTTDYLRSGVDCSKQRSALPKTLTSDTRQATRLCAVGIFNDRQPVTS
jgi:hypothetical protein